MPDFIGGFQNSAQRQNLATRQTCGVGAENGQSPEKPQSLARGPGTKKQLIGTIVGITAVVALLALKALNVI